MLWQLFLLNLIFDVIKSAAEVAGTYTLRIYSVVNGFLDTLPVTAIRMNLH